MDLFGIRRVPFMARRNYIIETQHLFLWGIFAGTFEGTVSSIVAAKTFNAGPWLITIVMATPLFANLMGLLWGTLATGRRKLPLFMAFAAGCAGLIASVAFTPRTDVGGWIFAAQIMLARMMLSGCITVRASLWKHNYPTLERGRIAARLQTVRFSLAIATVTCASLLFDVDATTYVYIYPTVAVIGGVAILLVRRMHVRGEKLELKTIAAGAADGAGASRFSPLALLRSMVDVLRGDRAYARYCTAMMCLGSANMMIIPIMTIILTKQLYLNYYHSCNLMEVLPRVFMMGSLMPWAGFFDRVGVIQFRVVNAIVWASATVTGGLAAGIIQYWTIDLIAPFTLTVALVALSRIGQGLGMGGGAIAWNIGHLHFAKPAEAEVYMGTHVFLAGIRGITAPFIGTFLYTNYGPLAFVVAFVLATLGVLTFVSLARDEHRRLAAR
ncbi:MAG: hypothetical protein JXQ75_03820 [Phycisphaerae bacterium]|nr:hypothetical protein [Phycisphaerae bacterium]